MSTSEWVELLRHRCFYVPWVDHEYNYEAGIEVAQSVAAAARLPLQVVVPTLASVPRRLSKADVVTNRSSSGSGRRRVVLLLHPTLNLLSKAMPHGDSYVVGVEFPTFRLEGWARRYQAFNLVTEQLMTEQLEPEIEELYRAISFNGNNAWADDWGKRDALSGLRELRTRGALNEHSLVAYMLNSHSKNAIENLVKLIRQALAGTGP